jgi:parvulin-like peptidyl-prolyl isomerase
MTAVLRNRHLVALVACCAAIALIAVACGGSSSASSSTPKGSVVVVNGQPVSKAQLDDLMQQYIRATFTNTRQKPPKPGSQQYEAGVQKVVQYLVQKTELEQQAKKLGVTVTAKDIDDGITKDVAQYFGNSRAKLLAAMKKQGVTMSQFRDTVAFSLLQTKLVQKLTSGVKVSDTEAHDYYTRNIAQYTQQRSRKIRHILVSTKAKAESIYRQLKNGASFATLAKKYSTDKGSAVQGGNLGVQPENGLVPAFAKVAFALPVDVISKPVRSQYGWHIIEATGPVIPKKVQPFSKVKAAIVSEIKQAKNSDLMGKFQTKLTNFYASRIKYANGYAPPTTTTPTAPSTTSVLPGG